MCCECLWRSHSGLKSIFKPCVWSVSAMQEELNAALSQLQELKDNLTELQKAHQVTQNQLRDKETINALIMSGLVGYRHSLLMLIFSGSLNCTLAQC